MQENNKIHHITIPDTCQAMRLDQALAKLLPEYSRTQFKEWIEAGAVLINGQPAKAKTKLLGGEQVTIHASLKPQPAWVAQAIPLDIVFEDDAILVINKPPGLVVHPGAGVNDQTLLNAILYHAPNLQSLPRAGILHRLDKNTSGLLVIAKTSLALKKLSKQLKARTIVREYQAVVHGHLISGGTIDAPISRHPHHRTHMAVVEDGKPSVTHYRIMNKYRAHTRLKVKLETGRTHQIRVHMAHIHHPVVGDLTYGGRVPLAKNMSSELIDYLRQFKRQALHACALEFTHPVSGELMQFEVQPPADMLELIRILTEDVKQQ